MMLFSTKIAEMDKDWRDNFDLSAVFHWVHHFHEKHLQVLHFLGLNDHTAKFFASSQPLRIFFKFFGGSLSWDAQMFANCLNVYQKCFSEPPGPPYLKML